MSVDYVCMSEGESLSMLDLGYGRFGNRLIHVEDAGTKLLKWLYPHATEEIRDEMRAELRRRGERV